MVENYDTHLMCTVTSNNVLAVSAISQVL